MGPERSDFFKGPKGPKGPLGPERSDFFKGPKVSQNQGPEFQKKYLLLRSAETGCEWPLEESRFAPGPRDPFGPLKKVASLRDPCTESTQMDGYTFYFMPRNSKNGRRSRPFCTFPGMQ